MSWIDTAALDRWITGNYGEDAFDCSGKCWECSAVDCEDRDPDSTEPDIDTALGGHDFEAEL